MTDKDGNTPLMIAIQDRVVESIRVLISNGADLNAVNKEGWNPLHMAVEDGRIDIVTLLLDSGVDVNAQAKMGYTALTTAARKGRLQVAKLLLERGADVNQAIADGITPLICATYRGNNEMAQLLLQHGADVNAGTVATDMTALMWAAEKCDFATVKMLLDAGARACHANKDNVTALRKAKDEPMKRLVSEYLRVDGPCWLVRELSARGLTWEKVCDVQDKLAVGGLADKASMLSGPCTRFDDSYLRSLGITDPLSCQVLIDLRLQSTWLGARLSAMGVNTAGLAVCEGIVFGEFYCATEACFAQLSEDVFEHCLMDRGRDLFVVYLTLLTLHEKLRVELKSAT